MELVKRVRLELDNTGKVEVYEGSLNNYLVYRDTVTKDRYSLFTDWVKLIGEIFPMEFKVSSYISNKECQITATGRDIEVGFYIEINEKGVTGLYNVPRSRYFEAKARQLFFYSWGAEFNTLNLFNKIYELSIPQYKELKIQNELRNLFPFAVDIKNITEEYHNNNRYTVKMPGGPSYIFEHVNNVFELLGHTLYDDERDSYSFESISDIKAQITRKKRYVEDMLTIKELITHPKADESAKKNNWDDERIARENKVK